MSWRCSTGRRPAVVRAYHQERLVERHRDLVAYLETGERGPALR